ncbi:MAG: hypothetical protein EXR63_04080 [Dehalococcoidia bacterium]|nr:hypothetical protein [Dehalococcoidia bacterium]
MADLRIQQPAPVARQAAGVGADTPGGGEQHEPRQRRPRPDGGAPELALALAEGDRGTLEAHYEQDAAGEPRIRIVDAARGETVAVLSPEELRALAEQTGLPPGLLLRATS